MYNHNSTRYALVSAFVVACVGCVADLGGPSAIEAVERAPEEKSIVGGTATTIAAHPWQISLQTIGGSHFCGGSILSAEWVVTANHCVAGSTASQLRVVAGATRLGQGGQSRNVAQIVRAPGFSSPENGKDVALLRLLTPLDLSTNNAKAIARATAADVSAGHTSAGVTGTVSGWGSLSSGGGDPDTLQAVNVPLVSQSAAQLAYSGEALTSDQLAAGAGGRDSCQGDSGGPLAVQGADGPILAGVVSWGYGCGDARYPGLYARVSSFDAWISGYVPNASGGSSTGGTTSAAVLHEAANVAGAVGSFTHRAIAVPAGASSLEVSLAGGSGDADLYVRFGSEPTTTSYDCRPYVNGNDETCTIDAPQAGTWFVSLHAYTAFSGAALKASALGVSSSTAPSPTQGQGDGVTIASDDFSSSSWDGGAGFEGSWARAGDSAITSGGARLRKGTGDMRRIVDVDGADGLELKFRAKVTSFEAGDQALVKVSSDGGATFTTVRTFGASDSDGAWHARTVELSSFAGASSLVIRFDANMSAESDAFYVDDVAVRGAL